jgi:uncharacterized surface protein with fasciclin (FAS1) repeats
VTPLTAHGFTVDVPAGWDARIYRRPAAGEVAATDADGPPAPEGAATYAVVHVSSVPMPPDIGDFGSSGVDRLGPDDAFVVVFDYGPDAVGQPLFARQGMPRGLDAGDFAPNVLQRSLPGQAGLQSFFTEAGRACCLYVVLGSYANRGRVVPRVNQVLADLEIEPTTRTTPTTTPSTSPPTTAPIPPTTVMIALDTDRDLSRFAELVERAGLTDRLAGPGPVTVFAPSDDALRTNPDLAAIEHDPARLARVVAFHVVADVIDVGRLAAEHGTTTVTTIEGHTVTVTADSDHAQIENASIDRQRIVAGNGSVYTIDGLLEPPA